MFWHFYSFYCSICYFNAIREWGKSKDFKWLKREGIQMIDLEEEEQSCRTKQADTKIYHKALITKIVWYWYKDRLINETVQSPKSDPSI